jgi:hypothetical protein
MIANLPAFLTFLAIYKWLDRRERSRFGPQAPHGFMRLD